MSKKKKDPVIEEYEKLKDEMIFDKVDEIFRTQPENYISALEEIGFKYYEDDIMKKKKKPTPGRKIRIKSFNS